MIPKIIHYCWVSGDPFPVDVQHCIDSWGICLPGYEIRRWTMELIWNELAADGGTAQSLYAAWIREAFDSHKYAFVADWVRFYALNKYGGIYLDSDVEVYRSFDPLRNLPYFVGFENGSSLEAAVMGAAPHCHWIEACLAYYQGRHFILPDHDEMRHCRERGEYISDLGLSVRPVPCIVAETLAHRFHIVPIVGKGQFVSDEKSVCVFPRSCFSFVDEKCAENQGGRYCRHLGVGAWKPKDIQTNLRIAKMLNMVFGHVVGGLLIKGLRGLRKIHVHSGVNR